MLSRKRDNLFANPLALEWASRLRIEQERMVASVPRNVGESDECPIYCPRCHPAETVRPNPFPPPVLGSTTMRDHEIDQLFVV
jgi:hypothetical protein